MSIFSKKAKGIVGLDIGSQYIRAIQLDQDGNKVLNYSAKQLYEGAIVDGQFMDAEFVKETIQKVFEDGGFDTREVAIALSGIGIVRTKKVEYEKMPNEEIMEAIKMDKELVPSSDDYIVDFSILDEPASEPNKISVMAAVAKRDSIINYLDLLQEISLKPVVVDVAAFAIQNSYEKIFGLSNKITALVNFGYENTVLNIIKNGVPLFVRDISIGGKTFNDILQRKINLTSDQVNELLNGETEITQTLQRGVFESAIKEITTTIADGLERSLFYLKTLRQDYDLEEIVLCGEYSLVPNAPEDLHSKYNIKVSVIDPLSHLEYDPELFKGQEVSRISPKLMLALGLALRKGGDK